MVSTTLVSAQDHPINSVTIFKSSKAEVVRTFSLELTEGQNKIEIKGLPSVIDTHSVRVSGLGAARLFDVVCAVGSNKTADDGASAAVRALRVRKQVLENQKNVREREAELLVKYAQTLTGEHVNPTQMGEFLQSFVEQGRNNSEAIAKLGEDIVDVQRLIDEEVFKSVSKKGSARGEVTVIIGAEETGNVELKLTYIVSSASWEPTYELYATTENGKPSSSVSLNYRARINQSTGEDWKDTAVTLSTVASDTMAKNIPHLHPIKIQPAGSHKGQNTHTAMAIQQMQLPMQVQVQQQQQQPQQRSRGGLFGAAPSSSSPPVPPSFGSSRSGGGGFGQPATSGESQWAAPTSWTQDGDDLLQFEEIAAPGVFSEPATVVSETPLAIAYTVEGDSTIPSDGVSHQVSIAILPFEASVKHITLPRIEPQVYLQCEVKNTSEYRLLPGLVSVILDDSYVSKTSINDIDTGDTFSCTLGIDTAAKVTYARTARTVRGSAGTFSEVTSTTTYKAKIGVHNKHAFSIAELVVRDIIPVCLDFDKRVKVILRKPVGLADAKDGEVVDLGGGKKVMWGKVVDGKGGERQGRFDWVAKVGAGEKVEFEAEWDIKAPADVQWVEAISK